MKKDYKEHIEYCEPNLKDEITLWILRTIIFAGGKKEFIDKDGHTTEDDLIEFLNIESFFEKDNDYARNDVFKFLKKKLHTLEKKKLSSHRTLQKNIKYLGDVLNFSEAEKYNALKISNNKSSTFISKKLEY